MPKGPKPKLTQEQAREAAERWERGETLSALGAFYGVHELTMGDYVRRARGVETPAAWRAGGARLTSTRPPMPTPPPAPFVPPPNPPARAAPFELVAGEAVRFWSGVAKPNARGCRLWTRSDDGFGYGQFDHDKAHRVAWRLTFGPIPDGKNINHGCDVTRCCAPDHLWAGTQLENIADMKAKGRAKGKHPDRSGEDGTNAKLTWEKVREIRRLRAEGVKQLDIAKRFGIRQTQVSNIVLNKQWVE